MLITIPVSITFNHDATDATAKTPEWHQTVVFSLRFDTEDGLVPVAFQFGYPPKVGATWFEDQGSNIIGFMRAKTEAAIERAARECPEEYLLEGV